MKNASSQLSYNEQPGLADNNDHPWDACEGVDLPDPLAIQVPSKDRHSTPIRIPYPLIRDLPSSAASFMALRKEEMNVSCESCSQHMLMWRMAPFWRGDSLELLKMVSIESRDSRSGFVSQDESRLRTSQSKDSCMHKIIHRRAYRLAKEETLASGSNNSERLIDAPQFGWKMGGLSAMDVAGLANWPWPLTILIR
jgi:hypothetical protein